MTAQLISNTLRITTLVALSALGACTEQAEDLGYKMGGLEADLEDGMDHLARSVGSDRIRDLTRSDRSDARPDERDVSDETMRDELIDQVRDLAQSDECEVRGVIMGDYSTNDAVPGGDFHGDALRDGDTLTAIFRGQHAPNDEGGGGVFAGSYIDHERSDGELRGTYSDPGVDESGPLGTFSGSWVESDERTDRLTEGNMGGVWLGGDHSDGGIFIGYWSTCSDVERPVDSREEDSRDEAGD